MRQHQPTTYLNSFLKSCFYIVFLQLPTICSFFTAFFNFLLFMSVTTSRCCNSQGIAFTSFRYFLLLLPTNTRSISVLFPPMLYVGFLCSFFSNHLFATHNSFFIANFHSIYFAKSIPTVYTLKTIISSPNKTVKVTQTKNHFTRTL